MKTILAVMGILLGVLLLRAEDQPKGDHVYVADTNIRELERNDSYVRIAWTAKVGNPTDRVHSYRTHVIIYDKDKFQLDDATGDYEPIDPHAFSVIGGKTLVSTKLWDQADSFRVKLEKEQ